MPAKVAEIVSQGRVEGFHLNLGFQPPLAGLIHLRTPNFLCRALCKPLASWSI